MKFVVVINIIVVILDFT